MPRSRTVLRTAASAVLMLVASGASGEIHLEWRIAVQTVFIGETVRLGLYAVSDSDELQSISAMNVIVTWDEHALSLIGLDGTGGATLGFSGFPPDPHQLNEANPPADGDAMYVAFAPLGDVIEATGAGTLITTFVFEARTQTPRSPVRIVEQAGDPPGLTVIYDGDEPNLDVTGMLGSASITIRPVLRVIGTR